MAEQVTYGDDGTTTMVTSRRGFAEPARWLATYALALIFLIFGLSKFAAGAGEGLAPLVSNSPLISWWHDVFGVAGTAPVVGSYEVLTALLIAARPINPRLSMIGGAMAVVLFLVTLTFLFSTPGVSASDAGPFPLSMLGQFLFKDLGLLALAFTVFAASGDEVAVRKVR